MRISDWSSDVCSSDLLKVAPARHEENRTVKPRHIAIIKPGQTGQKLDQRRADARTCRMIVRCIFGRQQPRLLFVIEVGAARGEPTEIDDPFALHEELLERPRSLGTTIGSDRLELADVQRVAAPPGLPQGKAIADALILWSLYYLPHSHKGIQPFH